MSKTTNAPTVPYRGWQWLILGGFGVVAGLLICGWFLYGQVLMLFGDVVEYTLSPGTIFGVIVAVHAFFFLRSSGADNYRRSRFEWSFVTKVILWVVGSYLSYWAAFIVSAGTASFGGVLIGSALGCVLVLMCYQVFIPIDWSRTPPIILLAASLPLVGLVLGKIFLHADADDSAFTFLYLLWPIVVSVGMGWLLDIGVESRSVTPKKKILTRNNVDE